MLRAGFTAISNRPTCCSTATACRDSSTSAARAGSVRRSRPVRRPIRRAPSGSTARRRRGGRHLALGVLFYELVSGHPPFYPDVTPRACTTKSRHRLRAGRIRPRPSALWSRAASPNSPMTGRSPCGSCAKNSSTCCERRAGARGRPLHLTLRRGSRARPPMPCPCSRNGTARDARPRPGAAPRRLSPRPAGRRDGAGACCGRLHLLRPARSFVALPAPKPPAAPVAAAPVARAGSRTSSDWRLKAQAEERRGPLPGRLQRLEQRDVATWGGATRRSATTWLPAMRQWPDANSSRRSLISTRWRAASTDSSGECPR